MTRGSGLMNESSRHYVILSDREPEAPGTLAPIGARSDVLEKLAVSNTGPESADAADVLYGPGILIELTPNQDPVNQMLVTITEEEIGWQVLARLVNHFQWKLLDPDTGRELSPSATPNEPPSESLPDSDD